MSHYDMKCDQVCHPVLDTGSRKSLKILDSRVKQERDSHGFMAFFHIAKPLLLVFILILTLQQQAFATPASTYVDVNDEAYRDIEKLVAFGLCPPPMIDQRPFLRSEFARLIAEAIKNNKTHDIVLSSDMKFGDYEELLARKHYIDALLAKLTKEFKEELIERGVLPGNSPTIIGHGLEDVRFDTIYMSSAPLTILYDNGVGDVSATVTPLNHYNSGRHAIDGFQQSFEFISRFKLSKFFAFRVQPRIEANIWSNSRDSENKMLLQEGYGVVQVGDAALTFGRMGIVYGPGTHGSLILTDNARPLDQIQISTPSPFRFPWIFKHLGQWRISLFGANLGPESYLKYTWLTGYRLSYMPVRYLELGFGNSTMMGGDGSPYLSSLDIFGEFFGFRPAGTTPTSPNKTNHLMEATVTARIPPLWGATIYGSLLNDDKRDTLERFFVDGSSYLGGLYLPRINPSGTADLRLEFRRMCAISYRHILYLDGYTLDHLYIGDALGSDALGFHANLNYDLSNKILLSAFFDWELRRSNMHVLTMEPDGTYGDTVVTQRGPADERYRGVLRARFQSKHYYKLYTSFGYERVLNEQYQAGVDKNNWLFSVLIKFDLDRYFRFQTKN